MIARITCILALLLPLQASAGEFKDLKVIYANRCEWKDHPPYSTALGIDKAGVIWNGSSIDFSTFETYVKETWTHFAPPVYEPVYFGWYGPGSVAPAKVVAILEKYGFAKHLDCPRIDRTVY